MHLEGVRHDVIVGLVGPLGTPSQRVIEKLEVSFESTGYSVEVIRISDHLPVLETVSGEEYASSRNYAGKMDSGDALRDRMKRPDAAAMLAISKIKRRREHAERPTVYIVRSFKRKEEVELFREIYGSRFSLIALYLDRATRVSSLASELAKKEPDRAFSASDLCPDAQRLLKRDESDSGVAMGQRVAKAFPLADLFVDCGDESSETAQIKRFVEMWFGFPFHTPSHEEMAMFHAHAASLRSASLGRQVGAVAFSHDGDILCTGTNEVPQAGGGQYWPSSPDDFRDHRLSVDRSNELRTGAIADLLVRLRGLGALTADWNFHTSQELVSHAMKFQSIRDSRIMDVLEYGRPVHGEMAVVCEAAARGQSLKHARMAVTTFPCHECARHIVAAGICEVLFIDPYPKSLVEELYSDSISIGGDDCADGRKIVFRPFVGVAPSVFQRMFTAPQRKDESDGSIVNWRSREASPRISPIDTLDTYLSLEAEVADDYSRANSPGSDVTVTSDQ